jgi:hypothetical protein
VIAKFTLFNRLKVGHLQGDNDNIMIKFVRTETLSRLAVGHLRKSNLGSFFGTGSPYVAQASPKLLSSSHHPASASLVAGTTGVCQGAHLEIQILIHCRGPMVSSRISITSGPLYLLFVPQRNVIQKTSFMVSQGWCMSQDSLRAEAELLHAQARLLRAARRSE